MNNRDAWEYVSVKCSVRAAARAYVEEFQLEENELEPIRHKFNTLKSARDSSQRSKVMKEWEEKVCISIFLSVEKTQSKEKIIVQGVTKLMPYSIILYTRQPQLQFFSKGSRSFL